MLTLNCLGSQVLGFYDIQSMNSIFVQYFNLKIWYSPLNLSSYCLVLCFFLHSFLFGHRKPFSCLFSWCTFHWGHRSQVIYWTILNVFSVIYMRDDWIAFFWFHQHSHHIIDQIFTEKQTNKFHLSFISILNHTKMLHDN